MNERAVWCEQLLGVDPDGVGTPVRWRTSGTARWMEPVGPNAARGAARIEQMLTRVRIAPLSRLLQFQRLAVGIMRDDHNLPLHLLPRVDFTGNAIAGDVVAELADEVYRGLGALTDIATPGWELDTGGRSERYLVLHPSGVTVRRGRGWQLVLDPQGLRLERGQDVHRIEGLGDVRLRPIHAQDVFAPAVAVLRDALHAAAQQRCGLQVFARSTRPG